MSHRQRLERLRGELERPLLVSHLADLRYLTGFAGSNGFLLVTDDEVVFVTDGRYGELAEQLVQDLPGVRLEVYQGAVWPVLGKVLEGLREVALEAEAVPWGFVRRLADELEAELVPADGVVQGLRIRKDASEVEALAAAARAGDQAFSRLEELRAVSRTEADLAWELQGAMREAGGWRAGWEPIVAVDANASLPHHRAGETRLTRGLLLLDYGCVVEGYHSDMSRTLLGPEAGESWDGVYQAVRSAQEAAIAAVRPGTACREVDRIAREVLAEHGYAEFFVHSTGHGVGLEIHEEPRLSATSDQVLEVGNVVTVEPGVYLPGEGGVRIEDMVQVTEDGPRILTGSSKEPR